MPIWFAKIKSLCSAIIASRQEQPQTTRNEEDACDGEVGPLWVVDVLSVEYLQS